MPFNYHHLNWRNPCSLKGVHNEFSQDKGNYPIHNVFWQWNLLTETLPLAAVSTELLIIPTVRMFSGEPLGFAPGSVWHYFHFQTCLGLGVERHGRISQHQRRLKPKGNTADPVEDNSHITAVFLTLNTISNTQSVLSKYLKSVEWKKWGLFCRWRDRGLDKES